MIVNTRFQTVLVISLTSLVPGAFAQATEALPQRVVINNKWQPDGTFFAFINAMRKAAADKKLRTIHASIAADFRAEGADHGLYQPERPAVENWERIFDLNGYLLAPLFFESGWKQLSAMLAAKRFQRWGDEVCGPIEATPTPHTGNRLFWLTWAYIATKNVRLHSQPDMHSPAIGRLGLNTVELMSGEQNTQQWQYVRTSDGKTGYVSNDLIMDFRPRRLCYRQTSEGWKFSAFIDKGMSYTPQIRNDTFK